MSKELLVQRVKQIVGKAKAGALEDAYRGYHELFAEEWFGDCRPEDQRQALKLMVHLKGAPSKPTPAMADAHRSALAPLTELVSTLGEPEDHEMLGMCHALLGHEQAAGTIFRAGLAIERERNPGSDLCGNLMKRISML